MLAAGSPCGTVPNPIGKGNIYSSLTTRFADVHHWMIPDQAYPHALRNPEMRPIMYRKVGRAVLLLLLAGSIVLGCHKPVVQQKVPPDPLLISKKPIEGKPDAPEPAPSRIDPQPPPTPRRLVSPARPPDPSRTVQTLPGEPLSRLSGPR